MKGLLVKDFKLLKGQSRFFGMIIALAILFAFVFEPQFLFTYIGYMLSLFTISTISYDEYDNGYPFLFTLPISRKEYVVEKFLFALIMIIVTIVISLVLYSGAMVLKNLSLTLDMIYYIISNILTICMLVAIMLPLQLKFGSEKGRIAISGAIGIIIVLGIVFVKIAPILNFDLKAMVDSIFSINGMSLLLGAMALVIAMVLISMMFSIKIMEAKEF
ncbi:MAG: ABC-2 transporter permease [Erysipelotrichaceae bacterium]|nr:ABC-2 transporter permease [Erysipelotrichaceae bacterium]MDY5252158.1 ABC-2 transporter permease [Erysipelotrichaceae bacterium]